MSDDDIKAGSYELVALQWDEPTSEPGKPFTFVRHRRGDKVKLNAEDARRLVLSGAVVKPGDREKAALEVARAQFAAAVAALPPELRDELGVDVPQVDAQPSTAPGADDPDANPVGTESAGSGTTRPPSSRRGSGASGS